MKNQQILIGTKTITTPNLFGKMIKETPKTITLKIFKIDFTPKKSFSGNAFKFDKGQRGWFNQIIGQETTFWKNTGIQIGGGRFIPNHTIQID